MMTSCHHMAHLLEPTCHLVSIIWHFEPLQSSNTLPLYCRFASNSRGRRRLVREASLEEVEKVQVSLLFGMKMNVLSSLSFLNGWPWHSLHHILHCLYAVENCSQLHVLQHLITFIFFSGQVSSTYERCCVLFNIGSLQSQIAKSQNFDSDEGIKNAAKHFQVSRDLLSQQKRQLFILLTCITE